MTVCCALFVFPLQAYEERHQRRILGDDLNLIYFFLIYFTPNPRLIPFPQRSSLREHTAIKFILSVVHGEKPGEVDFADWIRDGTVMTE